MSEPALPELLGPIEIGGRTLDVPMPDSAAYETLADWLENELLAKVERQHGRIAEDVWQLRYDAALRVVGSGALRPGTPEFDKALSSMGAREQLLTTLLRSKYPDVKPAQVAALFSDLVIQAGKLRLEQLKKLQAEQQGEQESEQAAEQQAPAATPEVPTP